MALAGLALGVMASQAGHLLAYQLRFGAAAGQLESTGVHTYFPMLVKTGLGLVAAFAMLALIAVGAARVVAGRKLGPTQAPSFLRLVAMLFCLQLACFVVQETVEMAAGAPSTTAPALLLWGTAGQLPVAVLAALALRWLAVRVGPALARLLAPAEPALRLTVYAAVVSLWPAVPVPIAAAHLTADFNRRGPPF